MCDHSEKQQRIAVKKQGSHKLHMERFSLKKLNEVQVKEKYPVEVSNRLAAMEAQIGLQHWKIWTLRLKLILSGK
jgi:hypothetical protein